VERQLLPRRWGKKPSPHDQVEKPVRFLDDLRVLEIASLSPNQLGMHLGDLGAEVIKIESSDATMPST
jgi:crotonobetainyl-CoA:carnitine CoA-transferase CaiB-like acyl-CoA transferase